MRPRAITLVALSLLVPVVLCACSNESDPMGVGAAAPALDANPGDGTAVASQSVAGVEGHVTGSAMLQVFAGNGLGLRKLTFSAVKHADGTVSGEWNLVAGSSILHGDIDCLHIAPGGATARLAGVVTDARFTSFEPGTAFALEVADNGNGGSGDADATSPVRLFRNLPVEVGHEFCETGVAPEAYELELAEKGNVTIHLD